MEKSQTSPIPILLTNESSDRVVKPDKHPSTPSTLSFLVEGLERLRKSWGAQKTKPKKLLIVSSKDIQGLVSYNENSFQLTLKEGILSASMEEEFQFQELPEETENTSA